MVCVGEKIVPRNELNLDKTVLVCENGLKNVLMNTHFHTVH